MRLRSWLTLVAVAASLLSVPSCLVILQDTTDYPPGYRETNFMSIKVGMTEAEVMHKLGKPFSVANASTKYIKYYYGPDNLRVSDDGGLYNSWGSVLNYTIITADVHGAVQSVSGAYLQAAPDVLIGMSLAEVEHRFGRPLRARSQICDRYLIYSRTLQNGSFHLRKIGLDAAGRVNRIIARWYQD
jgi:hypothetical protein